MTLKTLAPWFVTAAAVAFSAYTSLKPAPQVEQAPPTVEQIEARFPVVRASASASNDSNIDAQQMREMMAQVVREEMARTGKGGDQAPAAAVAEPTQEQLDIVDDGIALVDDLIDIGEITQEDVMDLRFAISEMDQRMGEQVLSAYFNALNNGDIVVVGAPL